MRKSLYEIVRSMVEDLLEEALRRDDYIHSLVDGAKGALGEYFKARYAEANTHKRKVAGAGTTEGWDREVDKLLTYGFFTAAATRMRGGDPRKAFEQATFELRKLVPWYLRWAKRNVSETFDVPEDIMIDPSDSVTDEFFARLENIFDEAQRV